MDDTDAVPSRLDLLDQFERLFGSRTPDFEQQAEELQRLRRRVAERQGEQFATEWYEVYGRPVELGRLAHGQWAQLGPRTKRHVVDTLQLAEPIGDEMSYLPASN
ncbi:hypothetical protein [Salinibacter altiplanensis]|uniref:hypothetical protein n=1 Tax=Salinibacter altiplanensis TaxID=1803181 RepID=UPI000C9F5B7E|nr:hypothetical protein [Salinibacter altiplanensis]